MGTRPTTRATASRLTGAGARWLVLSLAVGLGAAGAPGARPLDALLAVVDGHTIAASDAALARALGVLGLAPSRGPITRDDVERMIDARLLAEEARRLNPAPDAEARAGAWAAAGGRAGGPAALDAWLDAHGVPRDWARALVEQDLLRQQFIDQRFRAFVFVGESGVDAALGGTGSDPAAREATRRRLTEAAVARGLAEWLEDARKRARVHILLPPGGTAPLVLPMPGRSALRSGITGRIVAPGHRGPFSGPEDPFA